MPGKLTQQGILQAEQLRKQLETSAADYDALLCSPLERAQATARIINRSLKLPVVAEPLLCERDWGSITGCTIPPDKSLTIPSDAESVEQMFERARKLLCKLWHLYAGKRVLAVGHGLFNRVVLAAAQGNAIADIRPMNNAEVRTLKLCQLPREWGAAGLADEVSSN